MFGNLLATLAANLAEIRDILFQPIFQLDEVIDSNQRRPYPKMQCALYSRTRMYNSNNTSKKI